MEALSDDSFAWTDASSDFSDNMTLEDEESDSNAVYKKDMLEEAEIQKKKAKKRKLGNDTDDSNIEQKKQKHIKSEPESDFDAPKRKKKKKNHSLVSNESNGYFNDSVKEEQDSHTEIVERKSKKKKKQKDQNDSYDNSEYLLECRVKQEQESFTETYENLSNRKKKNKYKNESILSKEEEENMTFDDNEASPFYEVKQEQEMSLESLISDKQKKKHKNNKAITVKENNTQSLISSIQKTKMADAAAGDISETSVDHKKKKKKKKEKDKYNDSYDKTNDSSSQLDSENLQNGTASSERSNINSPLVKHNINEDLEADSTITVQNSSTVNCNPIASPNHKINRISDRLRFEDEESIAGDECSNKSVSKQLKQFAELNEHLTAISADNPGNPIAIEENDIWIIKCPRELEIKNLKNIKLTLDSKCKLKLNGQTYDGRLDDSIHTTPLLLHDKNKSVIKNVSLKGFIRYRKRIPKAHIPDYNIMVNNQTNFIPLPETKCRHPLFGINYKKATKVPQSVAERLNGSLAIPTTPDVKHKKKNHKREKCKTENEGIIEQPVELLNMEQELVSPKKKKKRKLNDDEGVYKKSKRIKPDPDSAEAWGSEQAIKNNLFGFE